MYYSRISNYYNIWLIIICLLSLLKIHYNSRFLLFKKVQYSLFTFFVLFTFVFLWKFVHCYRGFFILSFIVSNSNFLFLKLPNCVALYSFTCYCFVFTSCAFIFTIALKVIHGLTTNMFSDSNWIFHLRLAYVNSFINVTLYIFQKLMFNKKFVDAFLLNVVSTKIFKCVLRETRFTVWGTFCHFIWQM